MCKRILKTSFCFFIFFILIALTGCSKQLGYGVLLWSLPEQELNDGEIVPVYIKSNISKTYVISPMESDNKFEVPLWQLTNPSSLRETKKLAAKYEEYKCQYARVFLDGLPIREEPVNISKQIYRLRKDEVIKVLYKGTGQAVMSGSNAMKGDWLRVLTSDGTQGWCFSYNLRLFDIRTVNDQDQNQNTAEETVDSTLEYILGNIWYPEIYASMIDSHKVDLNQFRKNYAFNTGNVSGTVSLNLPGINVSYPYNGTTKTGKNVYKFTDTPISVTVRGKNFIVVSYTDEKGMPTTFNLVTLNETIENVITEEQNRRQQLYAQLESFGPKFSSSNYGKLTFTGSNSFTWSGYKPLQPNVIPRSALGKGQISFELFISNALKNSYDGVVTFYFDNTSEGVNFLYKIEDDGLRLETTNGASIKKSTVMERSSNPVVIFFANN